MIKYICDLCKRETNREKLRQINLPYAYENGEFKRKDFDICDRCTKELTEEQWNVAVTFIQSHL